MATLKDRVGIFGGTFDPVHSGHQQIANSFLKSGLIDQLLVLLTPDPPHKKGQSQADYSHRYNMLQLAFGEMKDVIISDLEKNLPVPSYTLQTIEYLQKKYPGTLFYLCMGEDSLCDFHRWHRYGDILERVNLIVARRPGCDSSGTDPGILEHVIFTGHEPVDISSTEIRQSPVSSDLQLPVSVRNYIRKHGLYKNESF